MCRNFKIKTPKEATAKISLGWCHCCWFVIHVFAPKVCVPRLDPYFRLPDNADFVSPYSIDLTFFAFVLQEGWWRKSWTTK